MSEKQPIQFGENSQSEDAKQAIEIDFKNLSSLKNSLIDTTKDIKKDVGTLVSTKVNPPNVAQTAQAPITVNAPRAGAFSNNLYGKAELLVSTSMLIGLISPILVGAVLALPYLSLLAGHLPLLAIQSITSFVLYGAVGISGLCGLLTILTPMRNRSILGFGLSLVSALAFIFLSAANFIRH